MFFLPQCSKSFAAGTRFKSPQGRLDRVTLTGRSVSNDTLHIRQAATYAQSLFRSRDLLFSPSYSMSIWRAPHGTHSPLAGRTSMHRRLTEDATWTLSSVSSTHRVSRHNAITAEIRIDSVRSNDFVIFSDWIAMIRICLPPHKHRGRVGTNSNVRRKDFENFSHLSRTTCPL